MRWAVLIEGFPARQLDTNCWVVASGEGTQSVVIDPGVGVVDRLDAVLSTHRLRPAAVLLTHGHLDHTFSVEPICRTYGIPAYIHPADRHQLADPWSGFGAPAGMPLFDQTVFTEPAEVRDLVDGPLSIAALSVAGLEFSVTGSPGHTPGSVLLGLSTPDGPVIFSGDTLFAGSIGRMDLPGGSEPTMLRTLTDIVLPLSDETVVHPGHGPSTTIGAERATNPYLLQMQRTAR